MNDLQEPTVSIDELQRRLGLGRMAVYRALRNEQIPRLKIGSRYIVTRVAFERFLEGQRVAS